MSITSKHETAITLAAKLLNSPYHFYATGSQEFREANVWHDLDYFVQDSPSVREYLLNLGFRVLSTAYVGDPQVVTVFRYGGDVKEDAFLGSAKHIMDVQCVQDVNLKIACQAALLKTGILQRMTSKAQEKLVWRTMYELSRNLWKPAD